MFKACPNAATSLINPTCMERKEALETNRAGRVQKPVFNLVIIHAIAQQGSPVRPLDSVELSLNTLSHIKARISLGIAPK